MKKIFLVLFVVLLLFSPPAFAQLPTATLVRIVKAEDARRWDSILENLLSDRNPAVRRRAALAAGRIGDARAVPALVKLLRDDSTETQAMAAFALGEIESMQAASALSEVINARSGNANLRARVAEALGKIAAANPKDARNSELGKTIVAALEYENGSRSAANRAAVLLGLTAILRARPEDGASVAAKFLNDADERIRADALNTLARLRAKNYNAEARELLARDLYPDVRANAARLLGVGEDQAAIDLLLNRATKDVDSRVRVSTIRSLGGLKEARVVEGLINLNAAVRLAVTSACETAIRAAEQRDSSCNQNKSELLEVAAALGRLLPNTNNQRAIDFLVRLNELDKHQSPEIEIALAKIAPAKFSELQRNKKDFPESDWRAVASMMAGIGELANAPDSAEVAFAKAAAKAAAKAQALAYIRSQLLANQAEDKVLPDALTAYAAFKTADLPDVLRSALLHRDAVVRGSAAGLIAEISTSKENSEALKKAFIKSLSTDNRENDAQFAILSALVKLDKTQAASLLKLALDAPDYLLRRHAANLIKQNDLTKDFPNAEEQVGTVKIYNPNTKTKLGQIFYTDADYVRAVTRRNARAILTTAKGSFTIEFFPEDAPLTVDNFIRLARAKYFNNLAIHRVVPNFVMQDGDPRGDGNGGPGWQIRCEINTREYARGAVGMALSGKDTGGSQWFVTHSPQPHLDGGYTVFGRLNASGMKIVDNLVRGDRITSVRIVEEKPLRKSARGGRK